MLYEGDLLVGVNNGNCKKSSLYLRGSFFFFFFFFDASQIGKTLISS